GTRIALVLALWLVACDGKVGSRSGDAGGLADRPAATDRSATADAPRTTDRPSGSDGLGGSDQPSGSDVIPTADTLPPPPPFDIPSYADGEGDLDQVPLPAMGYLEGSADPNWGCDTSSNDCHGLFIDDDTKILYELYNVNRDAGGVWHGGCLARWDLSLTYT